MKKILSIVAVVFVALVIIGVVAGKKDSPAAPAAAPAASSESAPIPPAAPAAASSQTPAVQSGHHADFGDFVIDITDVKIFPADPNSYENAPTIAFWYTVTNVSRDELSPGGAWVFAFEAYQDNNPNYLKELEYASLPDMAHLETQDVKLKKGGSAECSAAYILDDMETPVVLRSSEFLPIVYEQEFPVK